MSFVVDNGIDLTEDAVNGPWRLTVAKMQEHQSTGKVNNPGMLHWLLPQLGTKMVSSLVLIFIITDFTRQEALVHFTSPPTVTNPMSVVVVTNIVSLVVALVLTFTCKTCASAKHHVFNWHALWRFFGIALLFTIAEILVNEAYHLDKINKESVATVGYVYLPIAALLSSLVLRRTYGKLEQLSLSIMTLAVTAFIILHYRGLRGDYFLQGMGTWTFILVCIASATSALASILAERIYKSRSEGLLRHAEAEGFVHHSYFIHKVHLDVASLILAVIFWVLPAAASKAMPFTTFNQHWFGHWDWHVIVLIACNVLQAWFAGLITKHCSTVARSVMQTITTILIAFIADPLAGISHFESGSIPCILLAIIVAISVIIFQTGRWNIKAIQTAIQTSILPKTSGDSEQRTSNTTVTSHWRMYISLLAFIIADSSRTLVQQQALGKYMITPLSLVLMSFVCGVTLGSAMTIHTHGLEGLRLAYNPRHIRKALIPSFFFALASTLLSMAYAYGISPVLATVIGYVYMPTSALASRWILGKFYMWLEWLGLIVLTFASVTFGCLHNFYSTGGNASTSEVMPLLFTIGSAFSSVLGSLVSEKLLQSERDLAFHIQKIRLDIGSVFASALLLPVIGFLSSRPQDAFWKKRPLDRQFANVTCGSTDCDCECDSGLFVAWDNWVIFLALFITLAQSWFGGKVVKRFSTVHRAIAQSCSLLVIYFIGDPLLNQAKVQNWTLTLVAFIVPLSTATFMVAASEMETLMKHVHPSTCSIATENFTSHTPSPDAQRAPNIKQTRVQCEVEAVSLVPRLVDPDEPVECGKNWEGA